MKKRIFSLLLALCLVAGMLPTVSYAYDNNNGSTIDSGTFDEEVNNRGTINGGTFNKAVSNSGTIDNGEFNNTVTNTPGSYINNGTFNGIVYSRGGGKITGGTFNNTVNNDSASDYILGGTFNATVNNNSGATIQGGTFNGTVNNNSLSKIQDGTFYSTVNNNVDSYITGGTFYDKVTNGYQISGGTFYGDVENNKTITGGTFYGAVSGSGTISDSAVIWTKLTKDILESPTYKVCSVGAYSYRLPSGNYYLGEDISVDIGIDIGTYETPANVVLDLNGHELKDVSNNTTGSLIFFPLTSSTNTLTLMDSSSGKTGKVIRSSGTTVKLSKNAKLNANGGTIEGLVELVDNTAVIDNTDPSNVTVFTGWVSLYGGTIKGGIFTGTVGIESGTISDSAKVTVAFNSDGGSTVTEQKVLRGQKASAPTEPTKASYSFNGWYNGNTAFDFANTLVTENITLTAKWAKVVTATISSIPDETYTGRDIEPAITVYDGETVIPASEYTVSYSDNRNAGTATVTLTDKTGGNYVVSGSTTFEILPKSISDADIALNGALTYNGTERTQNVTVTLAGFDTVTFDVSGNKQTDVNTSGDYTLTVTGNGNFTGSKNLDWNIAPATPTENPAKKTTARVIRGRTLADATVTNGEILGVDGTTVLTGTFAWVDSTKVMNADGTEQMIFTPDNTNYAPITIDVAVSTYTTGGGSSSTSTYPPTVTQPDNGAVTVSPKSPRKGDTVTITPKPDAGYTVEQILVTDKNGDPVEVTNNGDGTYSFTQPAGKVNVNVTFMDDNTMLNFFVDVPANAYYYDAVLWAVEKGITDGTSATTFSPDAGCTRAQIVTFLWRAAGSPAPESSANPFTDVEAGSYYHDAVLWAVEKGITNGTSATAFSPDTVCTRSQTVTFLYRSAGSPAVSGSAAFSDVEAGSYYTDAVVWAGQNSITGGIGGGLFGPANDCSRAQIVTFLYRSMVK